MNMDQEEPIEIRIAILKEWIQESDCIILGAGAGLSSAAGYTYTEERFKRYFSDFEKAYDVHDMYSLGFYPFKTEEEKWAFFSRYVYINRYGKKESSLYDELYALLKDKDYFVITTNVDHLFQKAGFPKERLFYMQGDYGLFQCSEPCHEKTYDNKDIIKEMVLSQGYQFEEDGDILLEKGRKEPRRSIPSYLIPRCPRCQKEMSMNLRCDSTFVEDEGSHRARNRYEEYLRKHRNEKILFLELGVGFNTPGIIKYPFWQMTYEFRKARYVSINQKEAYVPNEIMDRAMGIDIDIQSAVSRLM